MSEENNTWGVGSRWLRWEPHIHAPGTLKNDQFSGDWDSYIQKIEQATPAPMALGITDYFTLRSYERVLEKRAKGKFSKIPLIFANIELRLNTETRDRQAINLHLLLSPEQTDHVTRMKEKLAQLQFSYGSERYPCSDEGLIRLGRQFRREPGLSEAVAMQEGANQFKVNFEQLRDLYHMDAWLKANVLIAIAAGNDGLAGLSRDAGFKAIREELSRLSHIVFSGKPSDREYWLGHHPDFEADGQTPKPCLHGSDAHKLNEVLNPDGHRFCWIRAEPTFDGLRQTLAEPERRVYIGDVPPSGPFAGEVIHEVIFAGAPWMKTSPLRLNDGLVTVIGARGSGKTALADLIAYAADAREDHPGDASFIGKANDLLGGSSTEIVWGEGLPQKVSFPLQDVSGSPRVRYLSQKFVEQLCTPEGLSEPLVHELETIVFNAIPLESRLQCSSFDELRDVRLESPRDQQAAERETIRTKTDEIAQLNRIHNSLSDLKKQAADAERDRSNLEKQLAAIPVKGDDDKARALQEAEGKLKALQEAIAAEERKLQSVRGLTAEIQRQSAVNEQALASLKTKFGSILNDQEWTLMRFKVADTALSNLTEKERSIQMKVAHLRANGLVRAGQSGADQGLEVLQALKEKTTKDLGLDAANAKIRLELTASIAIAKQKEEKTKAALAEAERANEKRKVVQKERADAYVCLFNAVFAEKNILDDLYKPLKDGLASDQRLNRLSFFVDRHIDLNAWIARGENIFDLRKPPFQGHGALEEAAKKILLPAWQAASAEDIRVAMDAFLHNYAGQAVSSLAEGITLLDFGEWLFSTDHISIRYGVQYEGVDLHRLSPGTRGVVLLTLYLALDKDDRRPLVVDQPEENLDPQSVYSQLVPFFKSAATRRQIIMVTHNANLVVNTDSDQVIVARANRIAPDKLPEVTYIAGGLEDPVIRSQVCKILEGGEEAFRKRGQRYGT